MSFFKAVRVQALNLAFCALALSSATSSSAAPTYLTVPLNATQTNLVLTPSVNPGFTIWTTTFDVTNNLSGSFLGNVNLWVTSEFFGFGSGLINAQWNNVTQKFETTSPLGSGFLTNGNGYLLLGTSDIPALPAFSVDPTDSLPVLSLGAFAIGQTKVLTTQFEVSNNVTSFFFGGSFTNTVPDGGTTVVLLGMAVVGLAALRRKLPDA